MIQVGSTFINPHQVNTMSSVSSSGDPEFTIYFVNGQQLQCRFGSKEEADQAHLAIVRAVSQG